MYCTWPGASKVIVVRTRRQRRDRLLGRAAGGRLGAGAVPLLHGVVADDPLVVDRVVVAQHERDRPTGRHGDLIAAGRSATSGCRSDRGGGGRRGEDRSRDTSASRDERGTAPSARRAHAPDRARRGRQPAGSPAAVPGPRTPTTRRDEHGASGRWTRGGLTSLEAGRQRAMAALAARVDRPGRSASVGRVPRRCRSCVSHRPAGPSSCPCRRAGPSSRAPVAGALWSRAIAEPAGAGRSAGLAVGQQVDVGVDCSRAAVLPRARMRSGTQGFGVGIVTWTGRAVADVPGRAPWPRRRRTRRRGRSGCAGRRSRGPRARPAGGGSRAASAHWPTSARAALEHGDVERVDA